VTHEEAVAQVTRRLRKASKQQLLALALAGFAAPTAEHKALSAATMAGDVDAIVAEIDEMTEQGMRAVTHAMARITVVTSVAAGMATSAVTLAAVAFIGPAGLAGIVATATRVGLVALPLAIVLSAALTAGGLYSERGHIRRTIQLAALGMATGDLVTANSVFYDRNDYLQLTQPLVEILHGYQDDEDPR
jgi:hypothetical protein